MTNDVNMIIDLWSRLKYTIPKKDRLDAAEILISVFDDYGMADGIENELALDVVLAAAVKSKFCIDEEDSNDN